MDLGWSEPLGQVTTTLNNPDPMDGKPVAYTYEPPAGTPARTGDAIGLAKPTP